MYTERNNDSAHKISVKLAEQLFMFLVGVDKTSADYSREKKEARGLFERNCQQYKMINTNGMEVNFIYEEDFYRFLCDKCALQVALNSFHGEDLPALLFGLQANDPDFDIPLPERLQSRVDDVDILCDEPEDLSDALL